MRELKDLSKVLLVLNKNQGEILLSTSYESLYKHGYRPYVRWGVLNETLAAACILESGVLDRAKHTGKLYLWDPFCGSGSFLIESLMYALDQPVRELAKEYPFEHWPIHEHDKYEEFRAELEGLKKIKSDLDIQIIGSDISLHAIETSTKNMEHAQIQRFADEGIINPRVRRTINNLLVYGTHWPKKVVKNEDLAARNEVINFRKQSRESFMSLYQGDFETIGHELAHNTNGFKDFTLLMNVPYGRQSATYQGTSVRDT